MQKKLYSLFIITLFLLNGCAATNNLPPSSVDVNYYASCYEPIAELRNSDSNVTKSTIVGAAGGALVGGIVGGLIAGNIRGAIIGAAAGAAGGGALGYAKGKQSNIRSARERYASYTKDIDGEINSLDQASLAAKAARACYETSFNNLIKQYKAKEISKEELNARYEEINQGMEEISAILGEIYVASSEKEKQFQAALTDEAQKANVTVEQKPSVAKTPSPRVKKIQPKPEPSVQASAPKKEPAKTASTQLPIPISQSDQIEVTKVESSKAPRIDPVNNDSSIEVVANANTAYSSSVENIATEKSQTEDKKQQMNNIIIAANNTAL